jgi:hypothetical protein
MNESSAASTGQIEIRVIQFSVISLRGLPDGDVTTVRK